MAEAVLLGERRASVAAPHRFGVKTPPWPLPVPGMPKQGGHSFHRAFVEALQIAAERPGPTAKGSVERLKVEPERRNSVILREQNGGGRPAAFAAQVFRDHPDGPVLLGVVTGEESAF